jgi:hypothetical protein
LLGDRLTRTFRHKPFAVCYRYAKIHKACLLARKTAASVMVLLGFPDHETKDWFLDAIGEEQLALGPLTPMASEVRHALPYLSLRDFRADG